MQFDDRLATVLRTRAHSDVILRTQFRQLIDLLGTAAEHGDARLRSQAYARLNELMNTLPREDQMEILREPGLRLRNSQLAAFLAEADITIVATGKASATIAAQPKPEPVATEEPQSSETAPGVLGPQRGHPPDADEYLIDDAPPASPPPAATVSKPPAPPSPISRAEAGFTELRRRIEEFRELRERRPTQPKLPLGIDGEVQPLGTLEFTCDAQGIVTRSSDEVAPQLVGLRLTAPHPGLLVSLDGSTTAALAARQPIRCAPVSITAAAEVSGKWWMEAAPLFDPSSGAFAGYRGCLYRSIASQLTEVESEVDRMRQVLHELRTPVNAIQGFAEIIQQQLFGTAPHQYRAHAAAISVDAAKLLAGFDEVDRLVKLEGRAMELEAGHADLHAAVAQTVQRLQSVVRARNAGFSLNVSGSEFTTALDRAEVMALCWRLLATAAGALGPAEEVDLVLTSDGHEIRLELDVPRSLVEEEPSEPRDTARTRAINAGMFGPAFTFRLARAEAASAGGYLICKTNRVTLALPTLTASRDAPSAGVGRASE